MARCVSCNRFVSGDDPEVQITSEEVNDNALEIEVEVTIPCAECSDPLLTSTLSGEWEIDHVCRADADEEPSFDILSVEAEGSDRSEFAKKKDGTPSKRVIRYYGANVVAQVRCDQCEEEIEVKFVIEEMSGNFDTFD